MRLPRVCVGGGMAEDEPFLHVFPLTRWAPSTWSHGRPTPHGLFWATLGTFTGTIYCTHGVSLFCVNFITALGQSWGHHGGKLNRKASLHSLELNIHHLHWHHNCSPVNSLVPVTMYTFSVMCICEECAKTMSTSTCPVFPLLIPCSRVDNAVHSAWVPHMHST